MFARDYEFQGKHAEYARYLKDEIKVFERFIDVYMNGAIFGLFEGRKAEIDSLSNQRAAILAAVFIKEKPKCEFIYRLVMLLDKSTGLTEEERIDRAFRDDTDEKAMKKNMELFNSYVLGGVEVLYEKFSENCTTEADIIDRVNEIAEDFIEQEIDPDEYLKEVLSSNF